MRKLQSLADAMVAALPVLRTDPDKLAVFADRGRIVASMSPGIAWEYRYTGSLWFLDYAGDQDALFLPLVAWVRDHQPDLFQNADRRADAITFEVEIIDRTRCDIRIDLVLSESVHAVARDDGSHDVLHADEPRFDAALLPDPTLPISTVLRGVETIGGDLLGDAVGGMIGGGW